MNCNEDLRKAIDSIAQAQVKYSGLDLAKQALIKALNEPDLTKKAGLIRNAGNVLEKAFEGTGGTMYLALRQAITNADTAVVAEWTASFQTRKPEGGKQ